MAQTARNEAEKATHAARDTGGNVAEMSRHATEKGADLAREGVDRAGDAARGSFQVAQRTADAAAEGAGELSQVFADLLSQQTRDGIDAFRELAGTVDWDAAARIQGEFARASLERSAEFTRRYFEVVQAVISSGASTAKEQTRKVA